MPEFNSYQVDVKVFVEEMNPGNEQTQAYSTGYLNEIKNFKSINYSVSGSLSKSFSITLSNPYDTVSTGLSLPRYFDAPKANQLDVEQCEGYVYDVYNNFNTKDINNPYNAINSTNDWKKIILNNEFVYGVGDTDPSNIVGSDSPYILGLMQRIWVVIKTDGLKDKEQYTIIAGIITSISETYNAAGEAGITLQCSGLSRILELTQVYIQKQRGQYFVTESEKYATEVLEPILAIARAETFDSPFAKLGLFGSILYAVWATNGLMTAAGRFNIYNRADIKDYSDEQFFYQAPIWYINNVKDLYDNVDPVAMAETIINKPLESMTTISNYNIAVKYDIQKLAKKLFDTPENITVADLLPELYYDDLIRMLYEENSSSGLQVLQKKVRSAFELFNPSKMSALEIINKVSSTIFATIREDDFGNIMFEIPRYWEAPYLTQTGENLVTIKKYYDFFAKTPENQVIMNYDDSPDYIIDSSTLKGHTRTYSEGNIITHVEAPANPIYRERTEIVDQLLMTGYSGQNKSDIQNQIVAMQRRFGFRMFNASPLYASKISYENNQNESVRLKVAMNAYADAILEQRNALRKANNFSIPFMHWLDINKNLFFVERGELWMISSKILSYSVDGDASMSVDCTHGHYLSEHVGYPYLDVYLDDSYAKDNIEKVKTQTDEYEKQKNDEENKTNAAVNNSNKYDAYFQAAAQSFNIPWDFVKSVAAHEGGFKANAESVTGVVGVMQVTIATAKQMKALYPAQLLKYDPADRTNPEASIWFGAATLKNYSGQFFSNPYLTCVAYNQGPGAVNDAVLAKRQSLGLTSGEKLTDQQILETVMTIPSNGANPAGIKYCKLIEKNFNKYSVDKRGFNNALKIGVIFQYNGV